MKNHQRGLAALPLVIIVVLVALGAGGWALYRSAQPDYSYEPSESPSLAPNQPTTPPAPAPIPAPAPPASEPSAPVPPPNSSSRNVRVDMTLDGVRADIYQGAAYVATKTTGSDGKFGIDLEVGQSYTFNFSKSGYQNKTLTIVVPADTYGVGAYTIVNYLDPA